MMQRDNRRGGFGGRSSGGRGNFGGNRGGFGGRSSGGRGNFGGNRGGFGNNNFNRGPREMHKAICSECKKECEVPFKPTEGKKVYCRECFQNHRDY